MAKLTEPQKKLLARIKRCKGPTYIERSEERTVKTLVKAGMVEYNGVAARAK